MVRVTVRVWVRVGTAVLIDCFGLLTVSLMIDSYSHCVCRVQRPKSIN